MKVLAINVSLRPNSSGKFIPVGFTYVLSAVERAGFAVDIIDLDLNSREGIELDKLINQKTYDCVLLGCLVSGYKIIKKLSSKIRKLLPNTLIVAGNSVASSIPDILLTNTEVDVAVIGEGEMTAVDLLESWKKNRSLEEIAGIQYKHNGKIIKNKPRAIIEDINSIPMPNWELFDIENYIERMKSIIPRPLPDDLLRLRPFPISSARGCIAKCTFCYHIFRDYKYRHRSPENVVKEMKVMHDSYGINYFMFWDDLCFYSHAQLFDFVDQLKKNHLEVYWGGSCRAGLFKEKDLDLLLKMKEAGCVRLGYALESADQDILKEMKKKISLKAYIEQNKTINKAGIFSTTTIVLGYPQETPETIKKTFQFCIDLGVYPSIGYLLPQPQTPMYDYAKKHGFIKDDEEYLLLMGDRQDLRLNMTGMSDAELEGTVNYWSKELNKKLGLGLSEDNLIKTEHRIGTQKND